MSQVKGGEFTPQQIHVFGTERMARLIGHEATPDLTQELFETIESAAMSPGHSDYRGLCASSLQTEDGRSLVAQVNPNDVWGFGSTIEDRALATVYGIRDEQRRVFLPFQWLRPAVYGVSETIFIDRHEVAKVSRGYSPLNGNFIRDLTAERAEGRGAIKNASEDEVREALDIVAAAVLYTRDLRSHI